MRKFPMLAAVAAAAALFVSVPSGPREALGQAAAPERAHPAMADPARLAPGRAEEFYQAIRARMAAAYAESGDPVFVEYQRWTRLTRYPYRAGNHGDRYANHYANDVAAQARRFEDAGALPVGSILIKDTFTATRSGQMTVGPLFLMEKMPAEFPSGAGSWRFMMLSPDGETIGLTGGRNSAAVEFCAACHHRAGADRDFLYFPPAEARRELPSR